MSRQLVALWTEGFDVALELMERCFPAGGRMIEGRQVISKLISQQLQSVP